MAMRVLFLARSLFLGSWQLESPPAAPVCGSGSSTRPKVAVARFGEATRQNSRYTQVTQLATARARAGSAPQPDGGASGRAARGPKGHGLLMFCIEWQRAHSSLDGAPSAASRRGAIASSLFQ